MNWERLTKKQLLDELEKLSISDNCLQASLDSAPWGIIVHDKSGKTQLFNPQLEKIIGYTKNEIPDIQSWLSLIHTDKNIQNIVLDEGKTQSDSAKHQKLQAEITRKDGKKRNCLIWTNLMPSGFQTTFITDLTSQKIAQETLYDSEERYRSLFNILPFGGELIDTKGIITNCSQRTAHMLGYEVAELIGMNITDLLDSDSSKIFHQKLPKLLQGEFQSAEICMVCKDGKKLHIQRAANPVFNEVGEVDSVLAINMDITELKKTEEALRIERDNLQSIFEAMEDGVFIGNQQFGIQYMNPVLVKEFGPYEGKKCYEYFNDRSEPCSWCRNSEVYAGKTVRWEWTSPKNNRTYDLIDTPITNPDGSISKLEIIRDISEHRQTLKTLKESEERYRSIFDNNHSVMMLIDPQTADIVDANPAAVSFYGWSYKELVGKKITEINTLTKDEVFEELQRAEISDPRPFLFSHRLANGEIRDVEVFSNSIVVDGEALLFSVVHDVTERKYAENKLAESESQLRSTLQSMSDFVFVLDLEGIFSSCHAPADQLFASPEEFIGKKFSKIMPAHVNKLYAQAMKKILQRKTAKFEYYLDLPAGKKWYSTRLSPLLIHDEICGSVAVVQDISDRKHAEKVLRQKQKVNDSLINSMPYPIMLINKDRVVLAANKMALDIGAKIGDYCWKEFGHCDYLSDEDKIRAKANPSDPGIQCTYCRVDAMFQNNEVQFDPEVSAFGKLWEIYWIPISDNEFLHYTIDISERKQAQNMLLQTSRMEATATLAAGVAHDFNNLMVGVLGYSELLKIRYETGSTASDMLDTIGDCARKAGDLAQQLLAYARGGKYQPKVLNLNDIIQETLRLNERSFPPRIRIERDIEPALLNVLADSAQMNQVVTNLCINSVEAIPQNGRIIITTRNIDLDEKFTSCHASLKPGPYVYLSVEDTGCGMDQATLKTIFEPFFSTKFQGRGLGLSAAYGIIKNHDGYISVYSEIDAGATFKIYLPAVDLEPLPEVEAKQIELTGDETILLVDDEKMVLDVTCRMLEVSGFHILKAHDGQEAVDLVQNYDGAIHLAILDMSMPVMGGPEAFPLLKKIRPDLKVIICSGFELDAAAQGLLDSGADSFLQKPFRREVLTTAVREILDSE